VRRNEKIENETMKILPTREPSGPRSESKNTLKTCNCQYVTNGKECGRPPNFIHAESGKVFCWNHYSRLSLVTSGWVNLQRRDAAEAIQTLRAKKGLTPLEGSSQFGLASVCLVMV